MCVEISHCCLVIFRKYCIYFYVYYIHKLENLLCLDSLFISSETFSMGSQQLGNHGSYRGEQWHILSSKTMEVPLHLCHLCVVTCTHNHAIEVFPNSIWQAVTRHMWFISFLISVLVSLNGVGVPKLK